MSTAGNDDRANETVSLQTQHGENFPEESPQVEAGYIGAVPAFFGDDHDGPLTATLSFRAGEADERLGTRGRCHLVSAIAMESVDSNEVRIVPSITTLRTSFEVTGPDDAVASVMSKIARSIATMRTDTANETAERIEQQWRPLERWDTTLMSLRFGCRGYGLGAFPLLGLKYFDEAAFSDWARTWYTAHNAVLSANRRPPISLDLGALGDGIRKALPDPHQVDRRMPAIAFDDDGRLAISVLTRFDTVAQMALELLVKRIRDRLNQFDGGLRRPRIVVRRTGEGLATVALAVEAPNEMIAEIFALLNAELFAFSMNGPTPQELTHARIKLRRGATNLGTERQSVADQDAQDALFGENRDRAQALSAESSVFARVARDLLARAIWLVPASVEITDRRPVLISDRGDGIDGTKYPPTPDAAGLVAKRELTVNEQGLHLVDELGMSKAVRFADLVALESTLEGHRILWGDDGTTIAFDPNAWQNGHQLGSWIEARVDPWLLLGSETSTDSANLQP